MTSIMVTSSGRVSKKNTKYSEAEIDPAIFEAIEKDGDVSKKRRLSASGASGASASTETPTTKNREVEVTAIAERPRVTTGTLMNIPVWLCVEKSIEAAKIQAIQVYSDDLVATVRDLVLMSIHNSYMPVSRSRVIMKKKDIIVWPSQDTEKVSSIFRDVGDFIVAYVPSIPNSESGSNGTSANSHTVPAHSEKFQPLSHFSHVSTCPGCAHTLGIKDYQLVSIVECPVCGLCFVPVNRGKNGECSLPSDLKKAIAQLQKGSKKTNSNVGATIDEDEEELEEDTAVIPSTTINNNNNNGSSSSSGVNEGTMVAVNERIVRPVTVINIPTAKRRYDSTSEPSSSNNNINNNGEQPQQDHPVVIETTTTVVL